MEHGHPFFESGVLAFAHRGGDEGAPENTLAAFQQAIDLGYTHIETDVHLSGDGVLFAFHDDDLDRVSDSTGRISDLTATELDRVRVGTESIPRLDDILSTWPQVKVNIDPKSDAAVKPLIDTLSRSGALDRVCIGSFSDRRLRHLRRELGSGLCTSMGPSETARLRARSLGFDVDLAAGPSCAQLPLTWKKRPLLDERLLSTAHEAGLPVHAWTINDPLEMRRLLQLGVDGIMTDRPELLRLVMSDVGLWTTEPSPAMPHAIGDPT